MKKFLVFTPSFKETSGGIVVLHKLCSLLNDLGYEAYLHPYIYSYEVHRYNWKDTLFKMLKWSVASTLKPYKTNPFFNTPVIKSTKKINLDDWVVVYPEVVFGNPLGARNVVRWLLHQPDFHEGVIYYGKNELYYKFNSAIKDFSFPGSYTSSHELKVIHYPLEMYNLDGVKKNRSGTAYCLRKGKHKKIQHDLNGSILIDEKTHQEISDIFKSVKTFISYDDYTAYSIFAVLCGCESVVIPSDNISEEQWYPNPNDRYGIAYGFENIEKAKRTAHLVKGHILREENKVINSVSEFVEEVNSYFD